MEMSGSREYGRLAEIWVEKYVGIGNVYRWHPLTSIWRQEKVQGLSLGLLYLDLTGGRCGERDEAGSELGRAGVSRPTGLFLLAVCQVCTPGL